MINAPGKGNTMLLAAFNDMAAALKECQADYEVIHDEKFVLCVANQVAVSLNNIVERFIFSTVRFFWIVR